MSVQVRFLVESFVTARIGAPERFLTRVNASVCFQVKVKTELFEADLALVGLFSCMYKHVSLQLSIVKESLIACLKGALKLD